MTEREVRRGDVYTGRPVRSLHPHPSDPAPWDEKTAWAIARLPGGRQQLWGVPFEAGSAEPGGPGLLVIGQDGATAPTRVPLDGTASYVMLAHVCDARARTSVAGQTSDYPNPVVTAPGEHLADYMLEYADGSEHRVAIRRRFEVSQAIGAMQSAFLNRPHHALTPLPLHGPYPADLWGRYQTDAAFGIPGPPRTPRSHLSGRTHPGADWWTYALPTPEPEKPVSQSRAWSVWPQHIAAHTSAVYVKAAGSDLFDNPTAEYLIATMAGGLAWLDTLATRDAPERHAAIRRVFEEAIAEVRARMT